MFKDNYKKQLESQGFPLTSSHINMLYSNARELSVKYSVRDDIEDIFQLSVIESIRLEPIFDASIGSTFMGFIRKPIKQVVQKTYGYPRAATNTFNKVFKFMESYLTEHKEYPTVPLIAKTLGITEFSVKSIYATRPQTVSLDLLGEDFAFEDDGCNASMELVWELLEGLPELPRKLIVGHYLEGYSVEELSATHKIPRGTIAASLSETLQLLKDKHLH